MRIEQVHARRIRDPRCGPTLEVDVRLAGGGTGRGVAPAGASRGTREAVDRRDGGEALGGRDVQRALASVSREIAPARVGLDASDQGRDLVGSATVSTSLAVLQTAALHAG